MVVMFSGIFCIVFLWCVVVMMMMLFEVELFWVWVVVFSVREDSGIVNVLMDVMSWCFSDLFFVFDFIFDFFFEIRWRNLV